MYEINFNIVLDDYNNIKGREQIISFTIVDDAIKQYNPKGYGGNWYLDDYTDEIKEKVFKYITVEELKEIVTNMLPKERKVFDEKFLIVRLYC